MVAPRYPSLYQVNTRVLLTGLTRQLGRTATLDDLPNAELDRWASLGFDWVWLLSVWRTGEASRRVSRESLEWRREFAQTLPDLREEDIGGSGFAITGYTAHPTLGGDAALARLRERLRARGLRLMLDFVPNHMALDHPWVEEHPEYFVAGTEHDLAREPRNYTRARRKGGDRVMAHGRDPYFDGWPDTLQLDYANPKAQDAMTGELLRIATQCDGVRCDMAMLVLPEVFARTWQREARPFWPTVIRRARERVPGFTFMAEVYWDLEWTMQQQGFDYAYDKRLYDRLRERAARPVREHFHAGLDYQDKLARFLENHDEPRAAATFAPDEHRAAAVLSFLSPGLRFFHQGQLEGRRKRISPHLVRGPDEPVDSELHAFYERLLAVLRRPCLREGSFRLLECTPAWEGNGSFEGFVAFAWEGDGERLLVVVNQAPTQGQCFVRLPFGDLAGGQWRLEDQLGPETHDRDGDDLAVRGLYVDARPWRASAFSLASVPALVLKEPAAKVALGGSSGPTRLRFGRGRSRTTPGLATSAWRRAAPGSLLRERVQVVAAAGRAVALAALVASAAFGQEAPRPPAAADSAASWEFGLAGALYLLPDEEDFLQPTFRADRGRLHLEARYNYEDRESASFFAGATFEFGHEVTLALTPMIGGLVGKTDGVIPGLEADFSVWKLEAYLEAEYVLDLGDSSSSYLYIWSELSVWPTQWLRAGLVGQRTRVYQADRDVQRGVLVGLSFGRVDGTAYFFNPGADDHFTVVSLGISF